MQPTAHQLMLLALVSGGFALLGALLGTFITGFFSLRAKRNEYVNDYYKKVIDRRIGAYEQLESLIIAFKTAVVDKADPKPFHLPFGMDNHKDNIFTLFGAALSQGLWLSDEAVQKTIALNYLVFSIPDEQNDAIAFGKEHYPAIAELRDALEKILASDMLEMHKVGQFLTRKKTRKSGFQEVQLYPPETPKPS